MVFLHFLQNSENCQKTFVVERHDIQRMCVIEPSGPNKLCIHRSVVNQWLQNCSPPMVQTNREPMASAQKTFRVSLIINEVPQIHDPKQTAGNSHFLFRHMAALWFCLCLDGLGIEAVFAPMQYSVLGCA